MKSEFCTRRTASLGVFSLAIRLIVCVCRQAFWHATMSSISLISIVISSRSLVILYVPGKISNPVYHSWGNTLAQSLSDSQSLRPLSPRKQLSVLYGKCAKRIFHTTHYIRRAPQARASDRVGNQTYSCRLLYNVLANSHDDRLGAVFHAKFLQNAVDVCFDRTFRDTQDVSDFWIATPEGHLLQHFFFALCQWLTQGMGLITQRGAGRACLHGLGQGFAGCGAPVHDSSLRSCTYAFKQHFRLGIF